MTLLDVPVLSLQKFTGWAGRSWEKREMSLKARSRVQWLEKLPAFFNKVLVMPCLWSISMMKSRRTDNGINYSEVTPACLFSSLGRWDSVPFSSEGSGFPIHIPPLSFPTLPHNGSLIGCTLLCAALQTDHLFLLWVCSLTWKNVWDTFMTHLRQKVRNCVRDVTEHQPPYPLCTKMQVPV